ncbi:MAG TPA: helix-turn-helix transcriptional regulator [Flavobacteriaceae bacterium]|nr:helix-turn-helix transcriptional regulator [Flavobacteriaceae bacterium]
MNTKTIHRVAQLIKFYGLSYNEFDRKVQLPTSYISKAINNESNIGSHVLEKIYRTFPVDGNWLLGANVPMERENTEGKHIAAEEPAAYKKELTNFEKGVLECLKKKEAKEIITEIAQGLMSQK